MAPKSGSGKEKAIEGQEEEILQAVILADSFNKRFKPLTVNKPRVRVMTHWSWLTLTLQLILSSVCFRFAMYLYWTGHSKLLHLLASKKYMLYADRMLTRSRQPSGVSFTTYAHLSTSRLSLYFAFCRESKWSQPRSGIKIVPIITAKEAFSAGDAMRDIYTHGIITSDFVLVSGDLVSSVRIDEVVRVHKERRKTNKDAIMTMVVKEAGTMHRTRSAFHLLSSVGFHLAQRSTLLVSSLPHSLDRNGARTFG